MEIPITLGLIYTLTVILNFAKRDWPTIIKRYLIIAHLIFAGLMILDIVLLLTTERTFRGVFFDRIVFWGLFITGGLFFSLFKGKGWPTKIYFGIYLFYPVMAMATFFIDRIMFFIVASPLIVSTLLPETYYKDSKFELRDFGGLMAPVRTILVEKDWLTEKTIGQTDNNLGDMEIEKIKIVNVTKDSINVGINYGQKNKVVMFKTSR
jgi:hypothetical protein